MRKKTDQQKEEQPPQPVNNGFEVLQVTSLEQLQSACEETFHVKAVLPSSKGLRVVLIPVRLLRPEESERLELILKEAHPPMKPVPQPDGSNRMEYVADPDTLEKQARLQKVARAMAIWWCCALFRESDEGKRIQAITKEGEKRNAIFEFVQGKFTETILEKIYMVVRAQDFQLERLTDFTTPAA